MQGMGSIPGGEERRDRVSKDEEEGSRGAGIGGEIHQKKKHGRTGAGKRLGTNLYQNNNKTV